MLIPKRRTALDGKLWWCVYNLDKKEWSSLTCFGKYKTKGECMYAIDSWEKREGRK